MKPLYLFLCLGLLFSCAKKSNNFQIIVQENTPQFITKEEIPEAKRIININGKGLNEYATLNIQQEVLFESGSAVRSGVLIDNGILYFGNENRKFYAIDINTKKILWMYSVDDAVQTLPVIVDKKIIFNAGNNLYVIDKISGKKIHKVSYPFGISERLSDESYAYNDSYTVVADGIAYYAALDGCLVAVDINSGKIIWVFPPAYKGAVASGINFNNGKLYYNCFGSISCLDLQTKQLVFQTQIMDRVFAPMYIDNGKIYAAGRSSKIFCIDAETGQVIWSSFSHDSSTWFSGGSVFINDLIFTGTSDEKKIIAYDKNTGEFIRTYPTGANVYTPPIQNRENIIVTATNVYSKKRSYIMEFDTGNHTKIWQAQLDDCVLSQSAIYEDVLYFGSDSGRIYCIKLN